MDGIIDIHSHLIPAVDDGAADMEEALKMIRREAEDGVRAIICTPHSRRGMFETPADEIRRQFRLLQTQAIEKHPSLSLFLGCEFHARQGMTELLRADSFYSLAGTDYVLTEFSSRHDRAAIRDTLHNLRAGGFRPILAHAERYTPVTEDLDFLDTLIGLGCRVQVNADAVLGKDGRSSQKFCKKLMQYDMLHFIASDAHDSKERPPRLGEAARYLRKKMGGDYARRILIDHPEEILAGRRE